MTEDRGWRWVAASVPGTSHAQTGLPCQDACLGRVVVPGTIVLVAADGAGSAAHAELGARLTCDLVLERVVQVLDACDVAELRRIDGVAWLGDVVSALRSHAEANGATLRDYACTLALAVIDSQCGAFFQIGDGAIVIRDGEPCRPVFWPQGGEYANTTYFVTDQDAADRLQFFSVTGAIRDVAVFTDGLQALALRFAERAAHAPFFDPMFDRLREQPPGEAEQLTPQLRAFLESEPVNVRTDDDKTLLLATRLLPVESDHSPSAGGDGDEAV